jgi:hypothetical protein
VTRSPADVEQGWLPRAVVDVSETALGRRHRTDPAVGPAGGPAGNARLTALLGLILLGLFLAELVTVLDVSGLITWHISIGMLLIPPSAAKVATTSWRIARYYTGAAAYAEAGPPPMILRVLGPLVVLGTITVLATGVIVTLLGKAGADRTRFHVLGNGVSALTLHQARVILWAVTTGLHVLCRLVPALQLAGTSTQRPPGGSARVAAMGSIAVAAVILAIVGVGLSHGWTRDSGRGDLRRESVGVPHSP